MPLTGKLTKNAESIPLGVFSFSPVFRAVCDIRRHAGDVSVSRPSLSGSGRSPSSGLDLGQNSLSLSLERVAELTGRSFSGCWFVRGETIGPVNAGSLGTGNPRMSLKTLITSVYLMFGDVIQSIRSNFELISTCF